MQQTKLKQVALLITIALVAVGLTVPGGASRVDTQQTDDLEESVLNELGVSASTTSISVESVQGAPGETVDVTLSATASDVAGFSANITYNASVVSVTNVQGGDLGGPVTNNGNGFVFMTASQTSGTSNPTLATITFKLDGNAGQSTNTAFVKIDTDLTDSNSNTITIDSYNGGTIDIVNQNPVYDGELTVGSSSGSPGGSVSVDVSAKAPDVVSFNTDITYDPSVVQVTGVGSGDFGQPSVSIDNSAGVVKLSGNGSAVDDPLLGTLKLDLVGQAGTSTSLEIKNSTASLTHKTDEIQISTVTNGSAKIVDSSQTKMSLGDVSVSSGSTVTVDLSASASGVAGYQANITWDSSVVTLAKVDGTSSFNPPTTNNGTGYVFLTQSKTSGTDNPDLATLTFKAVGQTGASTTLDLVSSESSITDSNGGTISVDAYEDGNVSVSDTSSSFSVDQISVSNQFAGNARANIPANELTQGETVTVSATVTNTGSAKGSTTVSYSFGNSSTTVVTKDISVSNLAAGASTEVYVKVEVGTVTTGSYTHEFTVSSDSASTTTTVYPVGDANHDGKVGPADPTKMQQAIVKITPAGTYNPAGGDINGDNGVSSADVSLAKQIIVGLYTPNSMNTTVVDSGTRGSGAP